MFGWFKRQDGFEWRNYVRTTILIRREKRRQKIDDARMAALDGLKDAGRKGAEIGASGLDVAERSVRSAGSGVWSFLTRAFGGFAAQVWSALAAAGSALRAGLGRFDVGSLRLPQLSRPLALSALAIAAVLAGLALYPRLSSYRPDQESGLAIGMTIAALLVLLVAGLRPTREGLRRAASGVRARLPGGTTLARLLPDVPPRTLYTGGSVAGLTALLLLGAWLTPGNIPGGRNRPAETATLAAAGGQRIEGRAAIKSGDTLKIDGTTVKLSGVEAPDRDQSCQRVGGRPWPCGRAAADALARIVRNKDVACDLGKLDSTGQQLATCRIADADVADQLVRNGHVFAETGLFATYASAESAARNAKSGVWSGEIERPSAYRAKRWEEAKRSAPEGCPIKGQVTSGTRVYVLPWSPSYERIKIRAARGERWFCSEKEAQDAGWKPVERS